MTNIDRDDLPDKLGAPARRALTAVGVSRLEQLTGFTEDEVACLHGMGPKAVGVLRDALSHSGLSFSRR